MENFHRGKQIHNASAWNLHIAIFSHIFLVLASKRAKPNTNGGSRGYTPPVPGPTLEMQRGAREEKGASGIFQSHISRKMDTDSRLLSLITVSYFYINPKSLPPSLVKHGPDTGRGNSTS